MGHRSSFFFEFEIRSLFAHGAQPNSYIKDWLSYIYHKDYQFYSYKNLIKNLKRT